VSGVWYPNARAVLQVVFDGYGGTGDDSEPVEIPIIPKSFTVHKNSYKQADSFEITFDANDLPMDPDLVRSGAIEIYLYQTQGLRSDQLVPSRQNAGDDAIAFAEQNLLLAGLWDEDSMTLDSSGKWVTITGQDYTAHLAAMQWPPTEGGRARRIPVGRRIDLILGEILAEADPDKHLRLVVKGLSDGELPVVGASEVSGNGRGIPVEQDTKYWDVMYKLAIRHGLIIFVDGYDVILTRPQNLDAADTSKVLEFAWGENVESLQLSRSLGKEQVPTIVVHGYDPTTHRTIVVEYPKGKREITAKTVKGDVKKTTTVQKFKAKKPPSHRAHRHGTKTTTVRKTDEFEIIAIYGITDPVVLLAAAENMYHLRGRAERKVVLRTQDLKDLRDANLLATRAGSAVMLAFSDYNRELLSNPEVPVGSKVAHLLSRGYNERVASVFAQRFAVLEGLRRPLRVREITYDYDAEDGLSLEMELVDFIVVNGLRNEAGA